MTFRVRIDLVLPAHNEGDHICVSLKRIQMVLDVLPVDYRIIVVDDGSSDDTFERISELRSNQILCIRLSRNFGKDAALKAGIDVSDADAVITMDSDLQHPPEVIPDLVKVWMNHNVDIVHAIKQSRGQESSFKSFLVQCYFKLAIHLSEVDLCNQSDFKLLDRRVVDVMRGFSESNFYFRGLTSWIGFKTQSVPFNVEERTAGLSKWSFVDLARLSVRSIVAFSSAPMKLILLVGALYFAASTVVLMKMLYDFFIAGNRVAGIPTVIALILCVGGTCVFSIGLVGIYVANIYKEVKGRPLYLIGKSSFDFPSRGFERKLFDPPAQSHFAATEHGKSIAIDEPLQRN